MSEDIAAVRGFVRAVLPDRVVAALAGYERFTAEDPPPDSKGFAAWHGAAKAALAHVEVLVKLVRWAEGKDGGVPGSDADSDNALERLLAEARDALGHLDDDEGGEP